ncbi:MAG: hypothetical protein A2821_00915 [Candidatus Magasanikbacteria bacterium RIFCSPHIGHO2_01_FULL_41_23]|uniref:Uncharacterized protein n=1 Tax=Candidatus Magasanikbacteria bacterium RIFCSPLOWO2_01_FULL_40_15 TaxID=1798686 RepID=A0A1F6N160_9BACT|nr:MAG: hypothetical protein A2821_00915 [Candidatus Magasanikbacteria bacterium RIFCSPHIGHO2_01_FULL_41_23]OGH74736.1 MAG: hypothetical protein A3F22_02270 [Candidatus Magasanikbacteria bacterium RIFCSPHIGHO2_12_FULL_41_16]OGH77450.1 MAG: hypothetical protein A2983_01970 [Candidatus Magasanikbacteria bacterium RIFCSPLOWO2_01_FULL_40_15]
MIRQRTREFVFTIIFLLAFFLFNQTSFSLLANAKQSIIAEPASFSSNWQNPMSALRRDLSQTADLTQFSLDNSALARTPVTERPTIETSPIPSPSIPNDPIPPTEIPFQANPTEPTITPTPNPVEQLAPIESSQPVAPLSVPLDQTPLPPPSPPEDIPQPTPPAPIPIEASPIPSQSEQVGFSLFRYFFPWSLPVLAQTETTENNASPTNPPVEPIIVPTPEPKSEPAPATAPEPIAIPILTPTPKPEPIPDPEPVAIPAPIESPDPIKPEVPVVPPIVLPTEPLLEPIKSNEAVNTPKSESNQNSIVLPVILPSLESSEKTPEISFLEFGQFALSDLSLQKKIRRIVGAKLGLSFANHAGVSQKLIVQYTLGGNWEEVGLIDLHLENSNAINQGYFFFSLPAITDVSEIQRLGVRLIRQGETLDPLKNLFVDAVWLELDPDTIGLSDETSPVKLVSEKTDFVSEENPQFNFEYTKPEPPPPTIVSTVVDAIVNLFSDKPAPTMGTIASAITVETAVLDDEGKREPALEPEVKFNSANAFVVAMENNFHSLKPGKYTLKVDVYSPDGVYAHEEDFTWGVLAINTNSSIIMPGKPVYMQMAALRDDGHTICDAQLLLRVALPNGGEAMPAIQRSGLCGPNNVVDVPDYYSYFTPQEIGTYTMTLKNLDNGYEIKNIFEVRAEMPVEIERIGPTRIFPPAGYPVRLNFKVHNPVIGTLEERIPASFDLSTVELKLISSSATSSIDLIKKQKIIPPIIREEGDVQVLNWPIVWQAGDVYELTYDFDAPDISPYLFMLGPASFFANGEKTASSTFQEISQWQIASDSIGIIDPNGDGTALSCTPTPAGSHYATVDETVRQPTTPDTGDFIICANTQADTFAMTTLSGAPTSTDVAVWVYYDNGNTNMQWELSLWNDTESSQYGSSQQVSNRTVAGWSSATFSGLTLTQTQLDGLRIRFKNVQTVEGTAVSSTLYEAYGSVTYTNPAPVVTSVTLNNGSDITLTENTTTTVTASATITDINGYSDIISATAVIYRSGVTNTNNCTTDDNNCYSTSCQLTGCSGNSCTANCTFALQFHADPTDGSDTTPWSSEYWRAYITATDAAPQTGSAFSTAGSPEVVSLVGIDVTTSSKNYGQFSPGENMPLTVTTTVTSTGNTSVDIDIYGADMTSQTTGSIVPVSSQRYATSSNTFYASSTSLTAVSTTIDINIPKTTSSSTLQTKNIFWGWQAPLGVQAGVYSGVISFLGRINQLPWP